MREGKVITVVPRTQRLTTQEAADFLGISRPTLVKLLEDGKIPYDQPGRHRRIVFTDLLAYAERQHEDRRAALDRMTEDASEAGIYGGSSRRLRGGPEESPQASRPPGERLLVMPRYTVVLDACVLVPIALADTLLRVAEKGLYRPLWSDRILAEAQAAIEEIHPGIDAAKRFANMREAFDDALVTGWEELEGGISLPDGTTGTSSQRRSGAARRPSSPPT